MSEYKPHWLHDSPFDPERCKAKAHDGERSVSFHQCTRKAWKDGWCKQHHPDTVAERRAQSELRQEQTRARGPWARLGKAQEEIARLRARIAELEAGK